MCVSMVMCLLPTARTEVTDRSQTWSDDVPAAWLARGLADICLRIFSCRHIVLAIPLLASQPHVTRLQMHLWISPFLVA